MKVHRRITWAAVVALASTLAACADEDRPPASESAPVSSVALGGSGDVTDAAAADPTNAGEPGPCEPRSHRDCKFYYRDDLGELHCPTSLQFCNVEGTEWLACGAFALDENGDPQPIH